MSDTDEQRPKTGGKRERTRAALIAATLDVVAEKGFAGASLDAIATRAGMSRGAIYSNFAGRGELLLAAMGSKGLTLSPANTPGGSLRSHLGASHGSLESQAGVAADALTLFGIGAIAVQRLEMWLRCQRLLAEARTGI